MQRRFGQLVMLGVVINAEGFLLASIDQRHEWAGYVWWTGMLLQMFGAGLFWFAFDDRRRYHRWRNKHVPMAGGTDGPVIGWRAWMPSGLSYSEDGVVSFEGRLQSMFHSDDWPVDGLAAECGARKEHAGAESDCSCGIYAMKAPHDPAELPPMSVRGVVLGWGRVQEHSHGFRAEHARIFAIEEPLSVSVNVGEIHVDEYRLKLSKMPVPAELYEDPELMETVVEHVKIDLVLWLDPHYLAETAARFYRVPMLPRAQIDAMLKEWT